MGFVLATAAFQLGCGTPQQKQARHLATGKRLLERKDYARAVLEFKNAVQLAPKEAEPYYQLGIAYLRAGDFRNAAAHLMKATELNPKHVGAQVTLAQMMATSRNKDVLAEAERRVQQAFAVSPDDAAVLDTLALTDIASSRPEDAEQHLQQALEKFPGHLRTSVMLANLKLAQRNWPAAEEILKKAVAAAPNVPEPYLALANLYLVGRKTAEAEAQFQQVRKLDPKNGPAILGLARLRFAAGKKDEAESLFQQLSALPEQAYRPHYALYLISQGKVDKGLAELESVHKRYPTDRSVRNHLVSALIAAGKFDQANAALTEALKKNKKDVDALLQRGVIFSLASKFAEAEQDLLSVLQYDPQSPEARFHLARVYASRGEALRARQELGQALQARKEYLVARLALANLLLASQDAKGALELMNGAPEQQGRDIRVIAMRNRALAALGNFAEARKGVDEGLKLARIPVFLVQDAGLKMQKNDIAGARASLEQALQMNPEDTQAANMLMASYVAKKEAPAGIEKLRAYVSKRPASAAMQMVLGNWLQQAGRSDEARAAFNAAKTAAPNFAEADLSLAKLDVMEGKADAARQRLTPLVASGKASPEAYRVLAAAEETAGNYTAAVNHYRKVLAASPENLTALNNLAYLLVEYTNQVDEGLRLAQKAAELAPNDTAVQDTIGWALYKKGLYTSAIPHLEVATKKSDRSRAATRKYHLAMAYLKTGDTRRGNSTLEEALKMDPAAVEAKAARELAQQAQAKK
ncbi:MAG: tetratricopeptide repeat protein [Bryobacteraceae bacterium]